MRHDNWVPPIVKTIASDGKGIEELADAISSYEAYLKKENRGLKQSAQNWRERIVEMLRDALLEKVQSQMSDADLSRYAAEVAEHKRDPYTLMEEILGGLTVASRTVPGPAGEKAGPRNDAAERLLRTK
jgi:LAO/AO transport system kinase